jgi:callose synthase
MLIQFKTYKFSYQPRKGVQPKSTRTGKSNYVETRSFWNLFRSFDRLWTFYLMALQVFVFNIGKWSCQCLPWLYFNTTKTFLLQAMFIIAWGDISVLEIFQKDVLYKLSSIFITAAILRLLQSMTHSNIWLCFCKFIIQLSEELVTRLYY